jgi:thymidine phosphorylase
METKVLLFVLSGVLAFFIALLTGKKLTSILIPAVASGVTLMFPVLSDPKAMDAFGIVGLGVFVVLSSIAYALSSAAGAFIGLIANRGLTNHSSGTR